MSQQPPERFHTDRLVVRRVRLDDAAPLFHAFGGSVEATRYLTWTPKASVEEYAGFLEEAVPAWEAGSAYHYVLQRPTSPPVGMLSLRPGGHGVDVGFVLSPAEWGRGLMAEAAQPPVRWAIGQPAIHRVWATCDVENAASARVLEKLGFVHEGVLRRWLVYPNVSPEPRDAHCYSRVS